MISLLKKNKAFERTLYILKMKNVRSRALNFKQRYHV